jgi:hypothetical protein
VPVASQSGGRSHLVTESRWCPPYQKQHHTDLLRGASSGIVASRAGYELGTFLVGREGKRLMHMTFSLMIVFSMFSDELLRGSHNGSLATCDD